ncbi:MAG: hypothetical protein PVJ84_19980 [Desulfobacteraceae bacterium]|jgi:hypothetical protein
MKLRRKPSPYSISVKLSLWSIRHQTWLAGQIRIYIFSATALIALLALAGVISIETALFSSFSGGLVVAGLIWTLIQQRKSILLNIEEPEVRELAHQTMIDYLRQVDPNFTAPGVHKKHQDENRQCGLS